jgi:D-glycero-D-manno-heptose 1,7-bisphosphate phosphatase
VFVLGGRVLWGISELPVRGGSKIEAVITAGGKGTRISAINANVPKPMINIAGKPVMQWGIENLVSQGVEHFYITIGHLGDVIRGYFGNGEKFGCRIDYITEDSPLGSAGALYYLKDAFKEDFLLANGDIVFDIDAERFRSFHKDNGGTVTLFTHPNNHPYDSGIIIADEQNKVTGWLTAEDQRKWYKNRTNAGLHIISPDIFRFFGDTAQKLDLDRDILKKLIPEGKLVCYDSPEYVKDMGTPERYAEAENDIKIGLVKAKSLKEKQSALFLDRDGIINKYKGFLTDINDFELNDGAAQLIGKANRQGKIVIVITNQPVIARGEITWNELYEIHNKMETLLGEKGAYVNAIYICPHHPHKGFAGERPEYKIECDCRKPKPGLLLKAAKDFNIDLANSVMIGDSESDTQAAKAALCRAVTAKRDNVIEIGCEVL